MKKRWSQPGAETYIPDNVSAERAWSRVTHLAIGAHQDDLEIMAIEGILAGVEDPFASFFGVVVSDGRGSARSGPFAEHTDEQMRNVRRDEQRHAADLGCYGSLVQLDFSSSSIKSGSRQLLSDLRAVFESSRPKVVYTHSLFDEHATHIAVTLAVLTVLRELPQERRPERVVGCEVWQDLDWLPSDHKVIMDVSAREDLQGELLSCFRSQVAGGKRYDLAALGRRRAHATFSESHRTDRSTGLVYGLDLGPLLDGQFVDPGEYISFLCAKFREQSLGRLNGLLSAMGAG